MPRYLNIVITEKGSVIINMPNTMIREIGEGYQVTHVDKPDVIHTVLSIEGLPPRPKHGFIKVL